MSEGDSLEVYRHNEQKDPKNAPVLDPDHPLLEKFQKALREHLLKQIEHLNNEILGIEAETKQTESEREQLGVEAYEYQQIACKQQNELDNTLNKLKDMCAERETLENDLETANNINRQKNTDLLEAEKTEMDLRNEFEALNLLLGQLSEYEEAIESELLVNQRISEKAKREKRELLEEKRHQDILIYKWMTQVWSLESEIDTMNMQLRVKEAEREKLAETAAQCNIEIEAFEAEYRCLMHSWNSVISAIGTRDKVFNNVKKELSELQSRSKTLYFEIENVKKATTKLIEENEAITLDKNKIEFEIQRTNNQLEDVNKKKENLSRQIFDTQNIIDQLERDLNLIKHENNQKNQILTSVQRELERIYNQKVVNEERIVVRLQEQMIQNKETEHLFKILRKTKERTRELEITLANKENMRSKLLLDTETQKFINGDLQRLIDDMVVDQQEIEMQIRHFEEEKKNAEVRMHRKQREIDIMIKRTEMQLMKIRQDYASPFQQKIKSLERAVEDLQTKNKGLQKYWLREQSHIVSLSEQRQEQLHELNFLRKQCTILQQRNLKIEDEMELLKKQGDDLCKLINKAQNRLMQIDEGLNKKRSSKVQLDKQIDLLQIESLGKLKDAELDCLRLDAEIEQIEEDKQNLTNKLIELNRECLAWEKKLKMALETKNNMVKEKTEGGEVAEMRAEIHRMNVRYSQLKKAQEKLINDLQYCVARRESIFTSFEAREKKEPEMQEKIKVTFNRKLDDMRNKLKKLDAEVLAATDKMEEIEKQKSETEQEIKKLKNQIEIMENQEICSQEEIDILRTDNLAKLMLLTLRQKKLQAYNELLKGKPVTKGTKSAQTMDAELAKVKETNENLIKVTDSLKEEFPNRVNLLQKIFNILTVHILNENTE